MKKYVISSPLYSSSPTTAGFDSYFFKSKSSSNQSSHLSGTGGSGQVGREWDVHRWGGVGWGGNGDADFTGGTEMGNGPPDHSHPVARPNSDRKQIQLKY